jgi:tetratricopeptide (TPR) repeat protein
MLQFLRKNSINIVYGIVITFITTTFLGFFFFNDTFQSSRTIERARLDNAEAVARIGDRPVTKRFYEMALQEIQATLPSDTSLTKSMIESLQLQALQRAIENTLLLDIGLSQKISVSRSDIKTGLLSVMDTWGVTTTTELKSSLKAAGQSYSETVKDLKDQLIVIKTRQALAQPQPINDTIRPYINKRFNIKTLFISQLSSSNVMIDSDELYRQAQLLRERIHDDASFDAAWRTQFPDETIPTPSFVWLQLNQIIPDIAMPLVTLTAGDISNPIKTLNGYYILQLKAMDELPVSRHITEEQLADAWGRNTLYAYLNNAQSGRGISVDNIVLKALQFKAQGNFQKAIETYIGMMSANPSDPYPNIAIAELYLLMGNASEAKTALLKAQIKESLLADSIVVPEIHILLAEIYDKEKATQQRDDQLNKLLTLTDNESVLIYLKKTFTRLKDSSRLRTVDARLDDLKKAATIETTIDEISSESSEFIEFSDKKGADDTF